MNRPNIAYLALLMALVLTVTVGTAVLKGGIFIGMHEGDTLQLVEMVLRMAAGEAPHQDFMTPIGVLALAPIVLFVQAGAGIGHAMIYAQGLVALLLAPWVLRAASSRFQGPLAYLYAGFVMLLCTALVHGEVDQAVSISMHYNRWAWAIFYTVLPLAMLEPKGPSRPMLDGAIIGAGMACLVLIKITYFVAFAAPVALSLILRGQVRGLAAALVAGLGVAGAATAIWGVDFWYGYYADLALVAASDSRPQPGLPLVDVLTAPLYLGSSMALLAGVVLLRQAQAKTAGLVMLLVAPGFVYVTYQNFGNDPQWLLLLGFVLFALRPLLELRNGWGLDLRAMLLVTGVAAFVQATPSAANLFFSPFRNFNQPEDEMAPLLGHPGVNDDLQSFGIRLYRADGRIALDTEGGGLETWAALSERDPKVRLNGEELADCELEVGLKAWFMGASEDLEQAGYAGSGLFAADLFSSYWLYGDFRPVKGASPWYYGGLSGLDAADYVIVPICPISPAVRADILKDLEASDWVLTEMRRTPLYILLKPSKP